MEIKIIRTIFTSLLLISSINLAKASPLTDGFSASYTLSKNGLTIARVKRQLVVKDKLLHFTSHAKVAGLAKLVSNDEIKERSVLEIVQGKLRSQLYSYDQKSEPDLIFLIFNWSNNTIINNWNNKSWPLTDNSYDLLGLQLAIAYHLKHQPEQLSFTVAEKKRIGQYQLSVEGEKQIHIAGKPYRTTVVSYFDAQKQRRFTFWCANELDFLPIRVERKDDDGDSNLLELYQWHQD
jgi:hypothetical protein